MHISNDRDVEADSVWAVRDQGAAEINISLLGHHINKELHKLHKVSGDTDKALDDISSQVRSIEKAAAEHGYLQMIAAAIEILQKYRRVTNRFEVLKRRYTPTIRCGTNLKFDFEGDGGTKPELGITYAGHMPYCGPTLGLAHMHVIRDHVNKKDDDDDAKSSQSGKSTPRRRGKGQKGEAPGNDSQGKNPKAPEPGAGIFKAGTDVHKGIFRCPSDMPIDPPQGHNQSEVLDLIN